METTSTEILNINKENIITTPYEKVLSIINDAIRYINITSKTHGKLIKDLSWVIKVITTHSLYTYELKDNDIIEKYSQENSDFKQFVDFVNEYNEEVIQMNKKTNIIKSRSFKISNQLQIPSFKLKKTKFLFNSNTNYSLFNRNKEYQKINNHNNNFSNNHNNNNDNLTYSYSPIDIIKNAKNLKLTSLRNVFKNTKLPNFITEPNLKTNNITLKSHYKKTPKIKSMDFGKLKKLGEIPNSVKVTSNNDLNYNNKYESINKNLKEIVIMPDIIYNQTSEIYSKTEKPKKTKIAKINEKIQNKAIYTIPNIENIISENNINKKEILEKEFNIFHLKSIIGYENTLPIMGKTILEAFGLINKNILQLNKLDSFLYTISRQYNKNVLYHNALHASDVTQSICLYFLNSNAEEICDTNVLDILSIFIAALGHDLGHPGLNNNFQINASTEMAITYNDISCLENYHSSKLFRILKKDENNIFEKLNIDERKIIRKRIINEILSTDMAFHGKVMSVIKAKIPGQIFDGKINEKFELFSQNSKNKFQEQQELLDFIIHCADLGHNSKLFNISIKWVELLNNEFWIQGDKEKSMNLPVSFLCDREGYDVPRSQVGFIKGFVIPIFDILVSIFPTLDFTLINVKNNLGKWEEFVEQHRLTGWTHRNSYSQKKNSFSIFGNNNNLSKFANKFNSQNHLGEYYNEKNNEKKNDKEGGN